MIRSWLPGKTLSKFPLNIMPRQRLILIAAGVCLAITMSGNAMAMAADALDINRQKELSHLVRHDCGSCHGMTLKGGLGSPLTTDALAGKDDAALAEIILHGIPDTPMPPWQGLLSKQDALWIAKALLEGTIK